MSGSRWLAHFFCLLETSGLIELNVFFPQLKSAEMHAPPSPSTFDPWEKSKSTIRSLACAFPLFLFLNVILVLQVPFILSPRFFLSFLCYDFHRPRPPRPLFPISFFSLSPFVICSLQSFLFSFSVTSSCSFPLISIVISDRFTFSPVHSRKVNT